MYDNNKVDNNNNSSNDNLVTDKEANLELVRRILSNTPPLL